MVDIIFILMRSTCIWVFSGSLDSDACVYIGLRKLYSYGHHALFVWTDNGYHFFEDGEGFPWIVNEPNGGEKEECVCVRSIANGSYAMKDISCNERLHLACIYNGEIIVLHRNSF